MGAAWHHGYWRSYFCHAAITHPANDGLREEFSTAWDIVRKRPAVLFREGGGRRLGGTARRAPRSAAASSGRCPTATACVWSSPTSRPSPRPTRRTTSRRVRWWSIEADKAAAHAAALLPHAAELVVRLAPRHAAALQRSERARWRSSTWAPRGSSRARTRRWRRRRTRGRCGRRRARALAALAGAALAVDPGPAAERLRALRRRRLLGALEEAARHPGVALIHYQAGRAKVVPAHAQDRRVPQAAAAARPRAAGLRRRRHRHAGLGGDRVRGRAAGRQRRRHDARRGASRSLPELVDVLRGRRRRRRCDAALDRSREPGGAARAWRCTRSPAGSTASSTSSPAWASTTSRRPRATPWRSPSPRTGCARWTRSPRRSSAALNAALNAARVAAEPVPPTVRERFQVIGAARRAPARPAAGARRARARAARRQLPPRELEPQPERRLPRGDLPHGGGGDAERRRLLRGRRHGRVLARRASASSSPATRWSGRSSGCAAIPRCSTTSSWPCRADSRGRAPRRRGASRERSARTPSGPALARVRRPTRAAASSCGSTAGHPLEAALEARRGAVARRRATPRAASAPLRAQAGGHGGHGLSVLRAGAAPRCVARRQRAARIGRRRRRLKRDPRGGLALIAASACASRSGTGR